MIAPGTAPWLGNEAVPCAALATLWTFMAREFPRPRRSSSSVPSQVPNRRRLPLALRTRLHGLRHACSPASSPVRRALWTLALCTALGLLLSWSSNRVLHWLALPTATRVHTQWARQLDFPTITICNNNPVRLPQLTKSDLYFAGHWLGLLHANGTARSLVLELLLGERLAWFRKLSDFRLFLPPRRFPGTSLEFLDRLGHQLDDMLLACKYRGEPCGAHNFSTVSFSFSSMFVPLPSYSSYCKGSFFLLLLCYSVLFFTMHSKVYWEMPNMPHSSASRQAVTFIQYFVTLPLQ